MAMLLMQAKVQTYAYWLCEFSDRGPKPGTPLPKRRSSHQWMGAYRQVLPWRVPGKQCISVVLRDVSPWPSNQSEATCDQPVASASWHPLPKVSRIWIACFSVWIRWTAFRVDNQVYKLIKVCNGQAWESSNTLYGANCHHWKRELGSSFTNFGIPYFL